ncbi:hypothetical protein DM02DRAFT_717087 [Periconia macrospinosa]|uniref:Polyprenal reductase n=1 Tax=Periconia macrospinosa TaxID=97972 RepID=A0A2V1E0A5_9PLEO|nr:hypothetical protein DM02DRAFT_717087 [Periconia macrospinosa]
MDNTTLALWIRVFYLGASALILILECVPNLRRRFLVYGQRYTPAGNAAHQSKQKTQPTVLDHALDYAASIQVPHNYFTHFYIVSVASSLFWGWHLQLWKAGGMLQMSWMLMLLQGTRRMLESQKYTSSSQSKMWVGHWVLGWLYYLCMNVALWVESEPANKFNYLGWRAIVLVPAILTAHYLQHTYHAYLYKLRSQNTGYQLPSHPLFPNLICPHYSCEIAIYTLLSFLAAPKGSLVNWTVVTADIFVIVNLAVTANATKNWYAEKFGENKVRSRKRMIPFVW